MPDMFTVASKEFSDIVRGRRFLILVVVFGLVMTAAVATTYLTGMQAATRPGQVGLARGFLGAAGNNLVTMMGYFAPVMGLALGVDAISGEKEKGTLKITLAQPVFRDTLINGKFLAALFAISLATGIASLVNVGGSMLVLGITPTGEDAARLMLFLLFAIVFAMTYYGIAALLSTVSRRTTQAVIIGVMLWAVFTFVIPIVASVVAMALAPMPAGFGRLGNFTFQPGGNFTRGGFSPGELETYQAAARAQAAITTSIQSIAPNYHFNQVARYMLNLPRYTSFGIGGGIVLGVGGGTPTLTIMQSLSYAWPNMLVLVLATVIMFIASYMLFTRQEIR
ncbi:MAG: ABC transporter permease subunit [Candidatus Bathyarchaeia archaeon]